MKRNAEFFNLNSMSTKSRKTLSFVSEDDDYFIFIQKEYPLAQTPDYEKGFEAGRKANLKYCSDEFIINALEEDPNNLRYVAYKYGTNFEIVMKTVKKNGALLQFATVSSTSCADNIYPEEILCFNLSGKKDLRDDKRIVLTAVKQNGLAVAFSDKRSVMHDNEVKLLAQNYVHKKYFFKERSFTRDEVIYIMSLGRVNYMDNTPTFKKVVDNFAIRLNYNYDNNNDPCYEYNFNHNDNKTNRRAPAFQQVLFPDPMKHGGKYRENLVHLNAFKDILLNLFDEIPGLYKEFKELYPAGIGVEINHIKYADKFTQHRMQRSFVDCVIKTRDADVGHNL